MRNSPLWWMLIGFMLLLDIYFFQALKAVTYSASARTRTIIHVSYWVLSIAAIIVLLLLPYIAEKNWRGRSVVFAIIAGLFFSKIVASIFFLADDLRRGIQWIAGKLFSSRRGKENIEEAERISRSLFLSWTGMAAGSVLFGSLLYGFGNKYSYRVRRVKLNYANLPASFRGLKIVQLSDIHSGSFTNKKAVASGVQKVMNEKPDLILFTGDLVNNKAEEMDDYMDVFDKLEAPMGIYAVMGNHDYGDYVRWDLEADKKANLEKLKGVYRQLGWRLLMNEHAILEKGADKIAVLGVENWSAKARFPKYGDLQKAYTGSENIPFKILMSHDPSHWKAQVLTSYPDIDLMLSGHTHGMQFGLEIPGIKWSPVQYVYKEWAGLYQQEDRPAQKLYVNRGFGFLGYPGRVGILPEITVLELS
ncbi:MAG TPA: metallophosphoesterase [Chitinophagaceae bacterium]|nr:metallophosphoesterase [Chitinophagaceae bacterium]